MYFEYAKKSLSVMPIAKKSKVAIIEKWQRFSEDTPTEDEIDLWSSEYQGFNLALVLGKASGLVALDIDTDNKETLDLCPKSPIVKRGKKGETRFFRYTDGIPLLHKKEIGIDILSNNSYTVLPPSIHPDTNKPYEWLTKDTLLNFDLELLPSLNLDFLSLLPTIDGSGKKISSGLSGRNNKLKDIVSAARFKQEQEMVIVNDVYDYDKKNHSPRLFTDKKEGFEAENEDQAKMNAWRFVSNITRSLISTGNLVLDMPQVVEETIDVESEAQQEIQLPIKQAMPYPMPDEGSMMNAFIELCKRSSHTDQTALGLGGAIALMSVLCSNRFCAEVSPHDIYTALYILNIANSGGGKETPQSIIKNVLSDTDLLGSGSYKSGTSIIQNLPDQQNRIDVIDEFSSVLATAGSTKDSFKSEVTEILCTLFSDSNSFYNGVSLRGEKTQNYGACHNPCVSILGSTTMTGFKSTVTKEMSFKGLMPRFLCFVQFDKGEYIDHTESPKQMRQDFKKIILDFLEEYPLIEDKTVKQKINYLDDKAGAAGIVNVGKKFLPRELKMRPDAARLYKEYVKKNSNETRGQEETFEYAFKNRFAELASKLALIHAVSCLKEEITQSDVLWGINVVDVQWANMRSFYEEQLVSNQTERNLVQIFNFIKSRPKKRASSKQISIKFRHLSINDRKNALDSLVEQEKLEKILVSIEGSQKKTSFFAAK